MYTLITGGE